MATSKGTRIAIWVIAAVMAVGTIGTYFALVIGNNNDTEQAAQQQKAYEDYLAQAKKQQEERQKTLKPLDGYSAEPFDPASVTELKSEVLVVGTGEVLTNTSKIKANYFGWTSDGKIFDSTNVNGTTTPIEFSLDGVIKGWTDGLAGKTVGSTVKLTIPAEQAYGTTDDGTGRPVGPLMFIVEIKELVQ